MIAHIFEDRCTACQACVSACPTHVLDAGPDGAPRIARLDQCQTCFLCELHCEADAIYVGPDQRQAEAISPEAILASGHLGRCATTMAGTGSRSRAAPAICMTSGSWARCCAKAPRSRRAAMPNAMRPTGRE
ncbi:4Fe-4S dicluster domain-containing protein [Sphingobium fuliginis]|uniref:4Fe-4S dicluster domain-containing protein n=1 Tax=Sphingobium fuliginis (strain ATCC 27551) TaxID=336203 RepID=UPI0003F8F143|nr:ferredoxin family protein [Sphingobium fuliginis]